MWNFFFFDTDSNFVDLPFQLASAVRGCVFVLYRYVLFSSYEPVRCLLSRVSDQMLLISVNHERNQSAVSMDLSRRQKQHVGDNVADPDVGSYFRVSHDLSGSSVCDECGDANDDCDLNVTHDTVYSVIQMTSIMDL